MNIVWVNNEAVLGKYLIITNQQLDFTKYHNIVDDTNIVIYFAEDLLKVQQKLDEDNISYTIEDIIWDIGIINKVQGVKFSSRQEAIDYLENDIIPEHLKVKFLENENNELKTRLLRTEDALLTLMFGGVS